jgi:hypothetical protein
MINDKVEVGPTRKLGSWGKMQKKNCILTDSEEKRVKGSKSENMELRIKKRRKC